MPMSQPLRIKLMDALELLRPDWNQERWHRASLNDATKQLAAMPGTPFELWIRALERAGVAANQAPVCITWTGQHRRSATSPVEAACGEHGGRTRRATGQFACCWSEGIPWHADDSTTSPTVDIDPQALMEHALELAEETA